MCILVYLDGLSEPPADVMNLHVQLHSHAAMKHHALSSQCMRAEKTCVVAKGGCNKT